MFHLLVKYDGWAPARDTIDRSRVFEYTDGAVADRYMKNGTLDSETISEIPALFMCEIGGRGDQFAHVGYIVRTRANGSDVNIDYALEPNIPPISIARIQDMSGELGIAPFEFSRTHWAIKDVDLFRLLLLNRPCKVVAPKVFTLNEDECIDDNLVSAMMPFDPRFSDVYETLKRTAGELKLKCLRADNIWEHDAIIQDIVSLIFRSRVVVCDCTGRNANVFYEAGIAHTIGKEVILITQHEGDIPFDLRHLRYIPYLNNNEGLQALSHQVKSRLATILGE